MATVVTVAPYRSICPDGLTIYGPGTTLTVADADAAALVAAGYVLVPGAGFAHRGLNLTGSVLANGTVIAGRT